MKSEIIHWGPWQIPVKATHVYCPDRKYRTIRLHTVGGADTFFTIPGQCQVRGKTVTGFVSGENDALYFWPQGNNFGAFFDSYDKALEFVLNRIVPNKKIDDFSMRDVVKFQWRIHFIRDLKADYWGDAWEIKGYDAKQDQRLIKHSNERTNGDQSIKHEWQADDSYNTVY